MNALQKTRIKVALFLAATHQEINTKSLFYNQKYDDLIGSMKELSGRREMLMPEKPGSFVDYVIHGKTK